MQVPLTTQYVRKSPRGGCIYGGREKSSTHLATPPPFPIFQKSCIRPQSQTINTPIRLSGKLRDADKPLRPSQVDSQNTIIGDLAVTLMIPPMCGAGEIKAGTCHRGRCKDPDDHLSSPGEAPLQLDQIKALIGFLCRGLMSLNSQRKYTPSKDPKHTAHVCNKSIPLLILYHLPEVKISNVMKLIVLNW